MTYRELEAKFVAWALAQPPIRAAVVVGSRARPQPHDALSDLDVIVFVTTPSAYAASPAWLGAFGALRLAVRHDTGGGDPEWLALYEGILKADFVLTATGEDGSLAERMRASPFRNVYRQGVRPLFNLGGPLDLPLDILLSPIPLPDPPSAWI